MACAVRSLGCDEPTTSKNINFRQRWVQACDSRRTRKGIAAETLYINVHSTRHAALSRSLDRSTIRIDAFFITIQTTTSIVIRQPSRRRSTRFLPPTLSPLWCSRISSMSLQYIFLLGITPIVRVLSSMKALKHTVHVSKNSNMIRKKKQCTYPRVSHKGTDPSPFNNIHNSPLVHFHHIADRFQSLSKSQFRILRIPCTISTNRIQRPSAVMEHHNLPPECSQSRSYESGRVFPFAIHLGLLIKSRLLIGRPACLGTTLLFPVVRNRGVDGFGPLVNPDILNSRS